MALQPSLRPLVIAGTFDAPHTLDIFYRYLISKPGSAKLSLAIDSVLVPLLGPGGKYHGKVKAIFRPQVQPWHGASTFVHEAGLAVRRVLDIPASTLTPLQIREKLAALAAEVVPVPANAAGSFADLLLLKSTPNGGNAVTEDLKYTIKFSRQNGIHVTPTVLWDGLIANEISSSWGEKEWSDFLAAKVTV
ncbi:hypothetical protein B0H19DRAFT_1204364 [Mycena capillaripes]|nr:hypothetical protein B0H19DRAFT_1204364 [Mycena capillaripes]